MAKNGRVKGQISLGRPKVSFTQNKNSGTNRGGQRGTTKLARSVSIDSGKQVSRNTLDVGKWNPHTAQTVGLPGISARAGTRARVAKSTSNKVSKNTHVFNPTIGPTIGLKGAGKPPIASARTKTNLQRQKAGTLNTVGLRGARNGGPTARAKGSNLRKTSPDAVNSQGIYRPRKQTGGVRTKPNSSGTLGKGGGGRKTPLMGNRRQVTSSLAPQKNYNSSIPAAVRRAAARAPSVGSSKPSFTSRVVKILSK